MDLWIRTQDKTNLIKVYDVYVAERSKIRANFQKGYGYAYTELGEYATEERALEVLDEIQGKITQNECLKTMIPKLNNVKGEEEKIGKLFKEMVYEMPEE